MPVATRLGSEQGLKCPAWISGQIWTPGAPPHISLLPGTCSNQVGTGSHSNSPAARGPGAPFQRTSRGQESLGLVGVTHFVNGSQGLTPTLSRL